MKKLRVFEVICNLVVPPAFTAQKSQNHHSGPADCKQGQICSLNKYSFLGGYHVIFHRQEHKKLQQFNFSSFFQWLTNNAFGLAQSKTSFLCSSRNESLSSRNLCTCAAGGPYPASHHPFHLPFSVLRPWSAHSWLAPPWAHPMHAWCIVHHPRIFPESLSNKRWGEEGYWVL